ncbi:MAG: flagellar M-ring protein FliF [Deltaproteobacteria bacterium]|nr:flagellar M-ring protein FliF [Deltaproteobacteria bacterium]
MNRLQALALQIRDFFLALPPARRLTFLALTVAVVCGTGLLAVWVERPQYRVLFSNLSGTDGGAVVEYLKSEKIPYRMGEGGATIEVDAARVYETRMALAGRGIPQGGGVGFEIFDKQTLGMTDFVQRLNYQRALQGELARTIGELAAVEAARVHLALPERSLFVAEERRPSASVVVKLRPGRVLNEDQIAGIVHLVAASVEGLKPAEVTVVDINGQVLTHELEENAAGRPAGQSLLAFQRELEQGYTERIESMLSRVLGSGHALARVTATLDLAQVEKTEESYDPDRIAVRTEKRSREKNVQSAASGAVGVNATLTNEPAPAPADEGPRSEREDAALNYEISKVTSRRIEQSGGIRKLSVAVMIDGTYQGEGEARTFTPRPSEEIDRYKELIKRAVGFNEERGDQIEVASTPFQTPPLPEAPEAPTVLSRLGAWSDVLWRAGGLLAIVVIALLVVRPFLLAMASRAPLVVPGTTLAAQRALSQGGGSESTSFLEIARRNPEQTAQVIRQWVAGAE